MRKQELLKLIQEQQAEINVLKHRLSILELSSKQPSTDKPWWASPYKITMVEGASSLPTPLLPGTYTYTAKVPCERVLIGEIPDHLVDEPTIKSTDGAVVKGLGVASWEEVDTNMTFGHLGELPPGRQRNVIKRDDIQLGVDRDH